MPASEPGLEPRAAICVRCHSPVEGELHPSASSGALWLGSARVPARDHDGWEPVSAPSVHRAVPGGCVGCHGAQPGAAGGTLDHSFRAEPRSCTGCHARDDPQARMHAAQHALQQRARALAQLIAADCPTEAAEPHHVNGKVDRCRTQRLTRARFEIGLVLEDPAAAAHNAAFANSLLDDAERQQRDD